MGNERQGPTVWKSFIEMLSVERTQDFVAELGLPLPAELYPQVMHLARACLEVYMAAFAESLEDSSDFSAAWRRYRQAGGALHDDALSALIVRLVTERSGLNVTARVYTELRDWIGTDTADALDKWFTEHYLPVEGEFEVWPLTLTRLCRTRAEDASLDQREWDAVTTFCERYQRGKTELGQRFVKLNEAARSGQPTLWEAVLQTFPADSRAGDNYPWLRSVQRCLRLKLFREEWRRLEDELRPDVRLRFTQWVEREVSFAAN